MKTLCMDTNAVFYRTRYNMMSATRWNIFGAFFNRDGIRIKQKMPEWDAKVVLFLFFSTVLICQFRLLQPSVISMASLPSKLMHSSVRGMGFEPFTGTALNILYPTQERSVPSFLGTMTTKLAHSASVDSLIPAPRMRVVLASSVFLDR